MKRKSTIISLLLVCVILASCTTSPKYIIPSTIDKIEYKIESSQDEEQVALDRKLYEACYFGNLEAVKEAIADGANLDKMISVDYEIPNPYIVARAGTNMDIAQYLILNGANPNQALDIEILKDVNSKKLLSPYKRNAAVGYVLNEYKVSERRACAVLDINRTAFRYKPIKRDDEDEIREKIIEKACNYGRTGYRQVTSMLRNDGILINHKRVERIWGEEGLKRPAKQSKKRRLWLNDGSCIRLRAEYKNHVWSYDFVHDKTVDWKKFRILNIIELKCIFKFRSVKISSEM